MNKKILIPIIVVVIGLVVVVTYILSSNKQETGYENYTQEQEIEVPIYDTGIYMPDIDDVANKEISVTITNLNEFSLPADNTIEYDFSVFVMYSGYFTESMNVELEYVEKDVENELAYNFKLKDLPVYGKYIDQAYVTDFWVE